MSDSSGSSWFLYVRTHSERGLKNQYVHTVGPAVTDLQGIQFTFELPYIGSPFYDNHVAPFLAPDLAMNASQKQTITLYNLTGGNEVNVLVLGTGQWGPLDRMELRGLQ